MYIDTFQVSGAIICAILLNKSKEGPFEAPTGCKKAGVTSKPLSGHPKLYDFKEIKSSCVLYSLLPTFSVGEKVVEDHFKDNILPSLE